MISDFTLQHYRFHLEPQGALQMPPYNKGNVIRGGRGLKRFGRHQLVLLLLRKKIFRSPRTSLSSGKSFL